MRLKFLGRGSGFNTSEGSTAAFFFDDGDLFLIDCGESVFGRIVELNLLDNANSVYFFCTHTHSDHIGSLGNLVLHCKHKKRIPFHVVIPADAKHYERVINQLYIFDCEGIYDVVEPSSLDEKRRSFKRVRYVETRHCKSSPAYSLTFFTADGDVFYSGDTCDTEQIKRYIQRLGFSDIYIDTTTDDYPGNVHMSLNILEQIVPPHLRKLCHCMHVNSQECIDRAKALGFDVVECEKSESPA